MRAASGSRVRRWLLLCALALGVIGMHHVTLAPHDAAVCDTTITMPMASDAPANPPEFVFSGGCGSDMGHDLMHLCLAVLGAAGGFALLAWLLMAVIAESRARSTGLRPPGPHARRLPATAGRTLLASVCVARI